MVMKMEIGQKLQRSSAIHYIKVRNMIIAILMFVLGMIVGSAIAISIMCLMIHAGRDNDS